MACEPDSKFQMQPRQSIRLGEKYEMVLTMSGMWPVYGLAKNKQDSENFTRAVHSLLSLAAECEDKKWGQQDQIDTSPE